jgi:hypothetical protein
MDQYFSYVPNFEYVSRLPEGKQISDYVLVKNIFKRAKIRADIFNELAFFTKYQLEADERPDNVANEVYNDPNLDWLVMLSNNYINYETEWPLTNSSFEKYLLYKYGTYENINKVRYYETGVIRDSLSNIIVPPGKVVPGDYSITFFDRGLNQLVTKSNLITVTNLDYENQIQDKRRNIFVLKATYVGLVIDDLEALMPYKKGSTQYLNDKTVRGNNIRLYS